MRRLSRPLGLVLIALLLATLLIPSLPGRLYWQRVVQEAGHGVRFAGIAASWLLPLLVIVWSLPYLPRTIRGVRS